MPSKAEATMNHFSHPAHPLHLISNHQNSLHSCSGCKSQATGGMVYGCKTCNYFLHASCAKKPQEITHPFDKGHVFTLRQYGEGLYNYCDACGKQAQGFCYHCKICKTDLHAHCASTPLTFANNSHPHQLSLLFSPPHPDKKFKCDVCNTQGSNHWLYRCDICDFDVHLGCKNVPIQPAFPNQTHFPQAPNFHAFNPPYGVATGIPMNQGNIDPAVMAFIQRLEAALYSAQNQNRMYQQYYYQPHGDHYAHMAGGGGFGDGFSGHGGTHGHGHGHQGGMQKLAQALLRIATGIGANIPGLDLVANGGGGNLFDILGGNGVLSLFSGLDLGSFLGGFGF